MCVDERDITVRRREGEEVVVVVAAARGRGLLLFNNHRAQSLIHKQESVSFWLTHESALIPGQLAHQDDEEKIIIC